jgi:hypothetical protein
MADNQMVFESVARLNATEPSKVGQTDSWSNPETKSSGSSTILRVFHSGGMPCHLVRHQIVASGSRLSPHLVPHAEPGMEDQGLIRRAERCPDIAGVRRMVLASVPASELGRHRRRARLSSRS